MRVLMLEILTLVMLAADPASETQAALADLAAIPPTEQPFQRYLSAYNADKPLAKVLDFTANSLSTTKRTTPVARVSQTLYRVDLRAYNWSVETWEKFATDHEHYFGAVDGYYLVVRADSFVTYSLQGDDYGRFLGFGATIPDVQEQFKVRVEDTEELRIQIGGNKLLSPVALHGRRLVRIPTITGYWWQSRDHESDQGARNVIDPEHLLASNYDAAEYIWSLPNGMQGYAIAGRDGKLIEIVPASIAQDYMTPSKDKQVYNAYSCVGCHSDGIKAFADDVAPLIRNERINLESYDYDTAAQLEDFFLSDLEQQFADDQESYRRAVERACGMTPEEAAKAVVTLVHQYQDVPVSPAVAARELGIPDAQLPLASYGEAQPDKLHIDSAIAMLLAGNSISRSLWEEAFAIAYVNVHRKQGEKE